jgi:stage IV sporulation protein FB
VFIRGFIERGIGMSWRDRDYAGDSDPMRQLGRPGGDWQGLRPTLENPLSWSFSIARIAAIDVRVHFVFLLFVAVMLLRSLFGAADRGQLVPLGFLVTALTMACLFAIVLAHEFGHALACRWKGGEANEILMWPLGGLAYCRPRPRWQDHMITVVGGPMVNVVICVIAGGFLFAITGVSFGIAVPNPLNLFGGLFVPFGEGGERQIMDSWSLLTLYVVNALSFLLLLFNLLPIFPLDGGRIVQAGLWPRWGYMGSMRFAVRTGVIGSVALLVFGLVMSQYMLAGIALFGAITCWLTHRQLTFMREMAGVESDEYAMSLAGDEEAEQTTQKPSWREKREQKRMEREQAEAVEVDRILKKIAESGMGSLSRREKSLLERFSQKKRQQR